jgi:hypothetical protein
LRKEKVIPLEDSPSIGVIKSNKMRLEEYVAHKMEMKNA